jgi:hypothetical protein
MVVSHERLFVPFSIHLLPSPTVFFYLLERKIFKRLSRVLNLKGIYRDCCDLENILEICSFENKIKIPPSYE